MIKSKELADPNSCLNRAGDDEMIFVLLARDVAAPHAIREWALERIVRGKNNSDDPQLIEALRCAEFMTNYQVIAEIEGNSFSQNKAIRATFPDPEEAAACLEVVFSSPALEPHATMVQIKDRMRLFQRDTINTLADCLVREAARLEQTNGLVTFEDLKREAQALRDYARTLAPAAPEVHR